MPEPTRIVITDCDHDSVDVERTVAAQRGVELTLARCRTEDDVVAAADGADGIVVQYAPVTADVLDALPRLRAVGRYGVGVDTVAVDAATERGVVVSNVVDYGTEDVSDHALALALSVARGVVRLDRDVRFGLHAIEPVKPLHRIHTRTFGVVGLGLIGAATARKARGIGYRVLGSDPAFAAGESTTDGVEVVGLDELLGRSDVVSVHAPLTAATRHLIGERALGLMKPGAVLINTSRGGLVDTTALVAAVREGRLAGAGLDVFETEPLPLDSPLRDLESVVLTPHVGWYSEQSYGELKRRAVENVADTCAGVRPRDVVNPEALGRGRTAGWVTR